MPLVYHPSDYLNEPEEPESLTGEEPEPHTSWAFGNGSPGCLFDNVQSGYESASDAAAAAGELFPELLPIDLAILARDHILYDGECIQEDGDPEVLDDDGDPMPIGMSRMVGADLIELFETDESEDDNG